LNQLAENNNLPTSTDALRNVLQIFFKRIKLISVIVGLFAAAGLAIALLTRPVYFASAKVVVEKDFAGEKALLFGITPPNLYSQYDWMRPELETIKSYPVAAQVVTELENVLYRPSDHSTEIDSTTLLAERILSLRRALKLDNDKNSNVIEIGFEHHDPVVAAKVVEEVIKNYITYRSQVHEEATSYNFFEKQMNITGDKISELEKRLAEFKERQELVSPEEQRKILVSKLADYNNSLTAVRTKRIGKEAKLSVIQNQLKDDQFINIPVIEASDSPSREKYIAKLKSDLLEQEVEREQLLLVYTPEYEEVIAVEKKIAATKAKISSEIRQIYDQEMSSVKALAAEEAELNKAIGDINYEIKKLAQQEYEYNQLNRGIDDNRDIYSMLVKQKEESRISMSKLEKDVTVKVISPAVVPTQPAKPNRKLIVVGLTVFGCVVAFTLSLLMEFFNRTIETPEVLERSTGLTFLGSVREVRLSVN
jgi:uncharacterized protein involved in exopolysaccharide biosynthesis